MVKYYKKYLLIFLLMMKISIVSSIEQPDFSELADELIPSVVSVSVIILKETINQPRAPQFPPGSPFEDFFKDFFERRGIPRPNTPPQTPRRNETAQGSGFIIDDKGYLWKHIFQTLILPLVPRD